MESVRKTLECPVCFEIPEGKIFQCVNSHHICEGCSEQCTRCPQCQSIFGKKKLRILPLETIRDTLEEKCSNYERGYGEVLKRKDLSDHQNVCFLRPIKLCKMLGLETCEFAANSIPPSKSIIHHLTETHKKLRFISWRNKNIPALVVVGLRRSTIRGYLLQQELTDGYRVAHTFYITLVHRTNWGGNGADSGGILMCMLTNYRYYSWLCLELGESKEEAAKFQVQLRISSPERNCEYKWTVPVFSYKEMDQLLKEPPKPISLVFLKEIPEDEDVKDYQKDILTLESRVMWKKN